MAGELDEEAFQIMIKAQLKQFMKRHVGARMATACRGNIETETVPAIRTAPLCRAPACSLPLSPKLTPLFFTRPPVWLMFPFLWPDSVNAQDDDVRF